MRINLGRAVLVQRKTRPVRVTLSQAQRRELKPFVRGYTLRIDGFYEISSGNRITDVRAIEIAMSNKYDGSICAYLPAE